MAAPRRPCRSAKRRARRIARSYQFLALAAACLCVLAWCAVLEHRERRLFLEAEDRFSLGQRRAGAVLLHCVGLLYMFVAIALVCDECFVPALEVITEVLEITPDVAGATFMAAGGSAPEFFTSLIGSLVTESDVGTGTIIGSAVFNVLFVIGSCALIAPSALQLTWFPLARDSLFYAVDLVVVTMVFLDEQVTWFEALGLFCLYLCYTLFMRYSGRIEAALGARGSPAPVIQSEAWIVGKADEEDLTDKSWATSSGRVDVDMGARAGTGDTGEELCRGPTRAAQTSPGLDPEALSATTRNPSCVSQMSGVSTEKRAFRHHSLRSSTHSNNIKQLESTGSGGAGCTGGSCDSEQHLGIAVAVPEAVPEDKDLSSPSGHGQQCLELTNVVPAPSADMDQLNSKRTSKGGQILESDEDEKEEDGDNPLSIWPPEDGGFRDMVSYLLTLPIVFVLVMTVPDVRREGWRKLFPLTFLMSILWIACFTWAMVWFCQVIGSTAGLSDGILGMTIIAAGTSVPDMLTSMIVAREGHGDMAISSSIGSNIFDVTVGLPVPWLIFNAVRGRSVTLVNTGLEISVMILLAMLGLTITTIMCHGWTMTKMMGASMLLLYIVFQGISIGLFIYTENGGSLKLIHV